MPFEDEFAHYKPLQRIANSEQVQQLIKRSRERLPETSPLDLNICHLSDLNADQWLPDYTLAVDGSCAEAPVNNGYPLAALGYITVASVMLDVAKMVRVDQNRPVEPGLFRSLESVESIDAALPGSNVVIDSEASAVDSFRRGLFELFANKRMADDGETLLDTYEWLLRHKPSDEAARKPQQCPYLDDSCFDTQGQYRRGHAEYPCECILRRPFFSTDALRIHEFMQPHGSNQSMFTETMSVVEHVWIIHILRTLEQKGWLASLKRLAIVLDGPLAVFGAPAWLSTAMAKELQRLNERAREAIGDPNFDMLMIGVEKSGVFVEHGLQLDKGPNGEGDALPRQSAVLLDDTYIKHSIIFSDSKRDYGRNTYFGRKLYYKTASGSLIVASLPFLQPSHSDMSRADVNQFPRLPNAMYLLDKLASARYRNSVSTLISAHAEAAIPLHLGTRVLERLAHQLMQPRSK